MHVTKMNNSLSLEKRPSIPLLTRLKMKPKKKKKKCHSGIYARLLGLWKIPVPLRFRGLTAEKGRATGAGGDEDGPGSGEEDRTVCSGLRDLFSCLTGRDARGCEGVVAALG